MATLSSDVWYQALNNFKVSQNTFKLLCLF